MPAAKMTQGLSRGRRGACCLFESEGFSANHVWEKEGKFFGTHQGQKAFSGWANGGKMRFRLHWETFLVRRPRGGKKKCIHAEILGGEKRCSARQFGTE